MAQRKQQSDTDDAEPFERYLTAERDMEDAAIDALYNRLPDWLPEPVLPLIRRGLAALINAGQSTERICEVVAQARADSLVIPGTVLDVTAFIDSAYYLAHVQWALGLDKAAALEVLGGRRAARDYQRSKKGAQEKYGDPGVRNARDDALREKAATLRCANPNLSRNAIARRLAREANLSPRQVSRILSTKP